MPIGLGTAALIGGGLAAVGTVGGSIISSNAQKKAAQQSQQVQQDTAAQQIGFLNNLYQQNTANEMPFLQSGLGGTAALMQALGLKPLSVEQYNNGDWYQQGTVDYTKPAAPTPATGSTGTGTGTGSPTPTPTTPGYTGPGLGQISSQSQMDAYLNYYRAHPEIAPPFTSTAPFHGDAYKDEDAAAAILAAHNSYTLSHPPTGTTGSTGSLGGGGATNFPATPAGNGSSTPAPASSGTPSAASLQAQAQAAIAAGADPAKVNERLAQMTQTNTPPAPLPTAQPLSITHPAVGGIHGNLGLSSARGQIQ